MIRDLRVPLRTDQHGLTLVEILVAVAIIGVAVAGVGIVVPVAFRGVLDGERLSTATFLAEQALERVRAATWTASPPVDCLGVSSGDAAPVPVGAACPGGTTAAFGDEGAVSGHPQYERIVRVASCAMTPCAGVTAAGLRLVEVSVAYTPLTGARGVSASRKTVRLAWLVSQK